MNETPGYSQNATDPSALTTQSLQREVAAIKELFRTEMDAQREAVRLLQANADKSPTVSVVAEELKGMKAVFEERFKGIANLTDKIAELSQKAIDAALQAAKELVGAQNVSNAAANEKMEVSFTKQIDGMTKLIESNNDAAAEKYDTLKERMDRGEGHTKGIGDSWAVVMAIVLAGIMLAALVFDIVSRAKV
jgi:hypothetical protein